MALTLQPHKSLKDDMARLATQNTLKFPRITRPYLVVLRLSLGDHKKRGKHPGGAGGTYESLGRIRPKQTLLADPSGPRIRDGTELGSARSAFRCSRLRIKPFGLGHSGCNYSFNRRVPTRPSDTIGTRTVFHSAWGVVENHT